MKLYSRKSLIKFELEQKVEAFVIFHQTGTAVTRQGDERPPDWRIQRLFGFECVTKFRSALRVNGIAIVVKNSTDFHPLFAVDKTQ